MLVVGSSGITIGAGGGSQPAGTLHAVGAQQTPLCRTSRVAYVFPAIAWSSAMSGELCPECVARTAASAAVPAQPTAEARELLLERAAE